MTSSEGTASARDKSRARRATSARQAAAQLTEAPAPSEPEDPTTKVAADAIAGTDPVGMPVLGEAVSDLGQGLRPDGDREWQGPEADRPACPHSADRRTSRPIRRTGGSRTQPGPNTRSTVGLVRATWPAANSPTRCSTIWAATVVRRRPPGSSWACWRAPLAPTNFLLGNPAALKRAFDTGGRSLVRGTQNLRRATCVHNGGMPSQVDREAFQVGERPRGHARRGRLTATRSPSCIQYHADHRDGARAPGAHRPAADQPVLLPRPRARAQLRRVRGQPRAADLHAQLAQPDGRAARLGPRHLRRARPARRSTPSREITGSDDVNVIGFCAGGILHAGVLNHLAAQGDERVHSAPASRVTLLDFDVARPRSARSLGAGCSRWRAWHVAASRRASTARTLGNVFTWMRPNDLVWNYWVNNYLMGNDPPAFDILAWNADGTNLPAALHAQFLDIFEHNLLCHAGRVTVLGTPVDLSEIKVRHFVTGAITDHLTPWKGCYRTTQLFGGRARSCSATPGTSRAWSTRPATRRRTTTPAASRAPTADLAGRRRQARRHLVGTLGRLGDRALGRDGPGTRPSRQC